MQSIKGLMLLSTLVIIITMHNVVYDIVLLDKSLAFFSKVGVPSSVIEDS